MTPEWIDGAMWGAAFGGSVTAAVMLIANRTLIPWLARQPQVRLWDRKMARARRHHGTG